MITGVRTVATPCFLCASDDAAPVWTAPDRTGAVAGRYTVARCRGCGFLYQRPRVSDEDLANCYPADYVPHRDRGLRTPFRGTPSRNRAVRHALARYLGYRIDAAAATDLPARVRARLMVRRLRWDCPPWIGQGRYLDVGCGSGWALAVARALGWRTAGIEMDAAAADKARRFADQIHVGDIMTAPFPPRCFDVVTAFHVLEHVPDPIGLLRQLLNWLAPGGLAIVEVPNAGGLGARLFGVTWLALELPRHLSHFTPATLDAAVRRAGGRVVWCRHTAKPRDYVRNWAAWLRDRECTRLAAIVERRAVFAALKLPLECLAHAVRVTGHGEFVRVGIVPAS